MSFSRRRFLVLAGASAAGACMLSPLDAFYTKVARGQSMGSGGYGPLSPKVPKNTASLGEFSNIPLLELPDGFEYTALSIAGTAMNDGNPVPGDHDGMAAFAGRRGEIILIRNHELSPNEIDKALKAPDNKKYDPLCLGGTTTVVVKPDGTLARHYASLAGTYRNCAGGPTPWGSWISCEENTSTPAGNTTGNPNNVSKWHGYNFEVAARSRGLVTPVPLTAMGRFNHEAIAVDPKTGYVYQTEDRSDSCFYRFRPKVKRNLKAGGLLEAMVIKGMPQVNTGTGFLPYKGQPMPVEWVRIDTVNPADDTLRYEAQGKGAAIVVRGEGAWYGNGLVYFVSTSGGNIGRGQVFAYNPANETVTLVVESENPSELDNPDNIAVAPFGDLILCEDGDGDQFVVGVNTQGELYHFARNITSDSIGEYREFCGACFSPDGSKLFFNIQEPGITFCVWGP